MDTTTCRVTRDPTAGWLIWTHLPHIRASPQTFQLVSMMNNITPVIPEATRHTRSQLDVKYWSFLIGFAVLTLPLQTYAISNNQHIHAHPKSKT